MIRTTERARLGAQALSRFLVLALAAGTLLAQDQSRLTGSVSDISGAAIPGARLKLSNVATGVEANVQSNASGVFVFPYVAPGAYRLTAEYEGFKTSTQTGITLETGITRTVNIRMEIGELTEVVTVEATTPLLESATSSVGQFIERETVFNMPLASRRSASLVRLMGNISYRSEDGGEQMPKFSMAGGRSQNQMWTLDGSVVQNMAIGTQQLAIKSARRVAAGVQGGGEQLLGRVRPRRRRIHRHDHPRRNKRIPRRAL